MATLRRLNFEDINLIIFYFTLLSNNLFHDLLKVFSKGCEKLEMNTNSLICSSSLTKEVTATNSHLPLRR